MVKTLPSNAGAMASSPGQGTKIPHAMPCDQKIKNIIDTLIRITESLCCTPKKISKIIIIE